MKNTRRKSRKLINRKKTRKYKGGTNSPTNKELKTVTQDAKNTEPIQEEPKSELEQKSLDELQNIKDEREAKGAQMMEDASTIATGVTANALEGIGNVVGVDLTDPKEAAEDLDNIKKTVSDPKNVEKVKEIVGEAAKQGAVVFEAAKPLVDPILETTLKVGAKTAEKMADTGATIFGNLVKEIPGVGLVLSLVQDGSKVGEAISATTGAASEILTQSADSAVVFDKNLKELKKEGELAENRTDESIKEFENPSKPEAPTETQPTTGGSKYKNKSPKRSPKNMRSKTKKVRFFL